MQMQRARTACRMAEIDYSLGHINKTYAEIVAPLWQRVVKRT